MSFDPEMFGKAMAEVVNKAVEPLKAEIADLRRQLAELPAPVNGKDGVDGRDGKSFTLDDAQPIIEKAIGLIRDEAEAAYQRALEDLPAPKDGKDGADGRDGVDGAKGEPGKDGADIADLMIDRDGSLVAALTDGRMKNLGPVVGKDGADGKDGQDGIGLDDFEIEYDGDSHEIVIRAIVRDRKKEIRYPAGGIWAAGYWRNGNEAKSGQAWTHDGSLWIATKDTKSTPSTQSGDWVLAARKGRDGERGPRGKDAAPPSPIKLNGGDNAGDV
ncbi:MAG TPA: hypothetical protein VK062_04185 [Burkholderiaceae bacterium]|nr:hypothetical protein [Burkholderiaceae bacterium]